MKLLSRKFLNLNLYVAIVLALIGCQKGSDDSNRPGSGEFNRNSLELEQSHYLSHQGYPGEFRELSGEILTDNFLRNIIVKRNNSPANDQEVLVVGAGVAGLVATIESFKNHSKTVTLAEKRSSYTRSVIMRLDESNLKYLENLIGQRNFNRLVNSHWIFKPGPGHPPAKRIIVLKKLEYLLAYIVEGLSRLDPSLRIHYGYKFDGSLNKNGDFELSSSNSDPSLVSCRADYLIGADSAHSEVAKFLNLTPKATSNISYAGIINYKNKDENGRKIIDPGLWQNGHYVPLWRDPARKIDFLFQLIDEGWEPLEINGQFSDSLPRVRIFVSDEVVYMAREFTKQEYEKIESLVDHSNKQSYIEKLFKLSTNFYFGSRGSMLTPLAEKTDMAVFPVQLTRANPGINQIFNSQRNIIINGVLIGDARATTHFFTGSGVNLAIGSARVVSGFRSDGGMEILELHEKILNQGVSLMHIKSAGGTGAPPDALGSKGLLALDRDSLTDIDVNSYSFRENL